MACCSFSDAEDIIGDDGLPESLRKWLYKKDDSGNYARDFPKIRVTMGPYNQSFFATDGSSSWWLNLPEGLKDAIKKRRSNDGTGPFTDMPRLVALGVDGDYFMLTEKHAASWRLSGYRGLRELIDQIKDSDAGLSNLENLHLHPYRLQTCIVQNKYGDVGGENLPPHTEEAFSKIKTAIADDILADLKRLETAAAEAEKTTQTQRLLAQAQRIVAMEEQTRQLVELRRQREMMEQAMLMRQQAELRQLNQTINMINAMNIGFMMGNLGFGGSLF